MMPRKSRFVSHFFNPISDPLNWDLDSRDVSNLNMKPIAFGTHEILGGLPWIPSKQWRTWLKPPLVKVGFWPRRYILIWSTRFSSLPKADAWIKLVHWSLKNNLGLQKIRDSQTGVWFDAFSLIGNHWNSTSLNHGWCWQYLCCHFSASKSDVVVVQRWASNVRIAPSKIQELVICWCF